MWPNPIQLRLLVAVSGPADESPDEVLFYSYLPNEPLSKERIEAFSDGVYAIVATLLILDIWCVSLKTISFCLYKKKLNSSSCTIEFS